nr:hypothetical protein [Tanacetum cinerariifolium]
FAGELTLLKSIPPRFDETDSYLEKETHFTKRLLYDNSSPPPPEEFVFDNSDAEIESFSPSPIPVKDSDSLADCDPEEEIRLIKKLLYDNSSPYPPEEFISENSDAAIKSFSSSPILVEDNDSLGDEIDLSLTPDDSMPPGIQDDEYDPKGDILILEELLRNDS